ncbi:hypothetical protein SUDANB126_00665 [Streptomyces sp. enrichment culture]
MEDRRDADGFLDLEMTVTLNGKLIGRDTLANVSWTFEEMVAYASRDAWVRPDMRPPWPAPRQPPDRPPRQRAGTRPVENLTPTTPG